MINFFKLFRKSTIRTKKEEVSPKITKRRKSQSPKRNNNSEQNSGRKDAKNSSKSKNSSTVNCGETIYNDEQAPYAVNTVLASLSLNSRNFGLDLADISSQLERIKEEQEPLENEKEQLAGSSLKQNSQKLHSLLPVSKSREKFERSLNSTLPVVSSNTTNDFSSLSFSNTDREKDEEKTICLSPLNHFEVQNFSPKMEVRKLSPKIEILPRSISTSKERNLPHSSSNDAFLGSNNQMSLLSDSKRQTALEPRVIFSSQQIINSELNCGDTKVVSPGQNLPNKFIGFEQRELKSRGSINSTKFIRGFSKSVEQNLNCSNVSDTTGFSTTISASVDLLPLKHEGSEKELASLNQIDEKLRNCCEKAANVFTVKCDTDSMLQNCYVRNDTSYCVGGVLCNCFPQIGAPRGRNSEQEDEIVNSRSCVNLVENEEKGESNIYNDKIDQKKCTIENKKPVLFVENKNQFGDTANNQICDKFQMLEENNASTSFVLCKMEKSLTGQNSMIVPKLDFSGLESDSDQLVAAESNVHWDLLIGRCFAYNNICFWFSL